MIENRIDLMQSTMEIASNIRSEIEAETLQRAATLKSETKTPSICRPEGTPSILRFANEEDFHPVLVGAINRFGMALSRMGL